MADPNLRLLVNGVGYSGWESIRVTRGIESVCGSFDLTVSDRKPAPWSRRVQLPVFPEDECRVEVGGETVICGYVDKRDVSLGPQEHTITLGGRDRASALIDNGALPKRWEYAAASPLAIAQALAKPFGITVSAQAGLKLSPVAKLTIDPGDSAWDAIEKACRSAGVLAISDGEGGVVLTRAGSARASSAIVEGQNLMAGSHTTDASGRFARYVVMAQHQGSADFFGSAAAAVRGEARDAAVRRGARVLVVRAEGNASAAQAKRRAQWEATVRAARAATISVTVRGWTQADGTLWPINALVRVRSPRLEVDGEFLSTQATYSKSEGGTTTQLSLLRPDAFIPEPVVQKDAGERWAELNR